MSADLKVASKWVKVFGWSIIKIIVKKTYMRTKLDYFTI